MGFFLYILFEIYIRAFVTISFCHECTNNTIDSIYYIPMRVSNPRDDKSNSELISYVIIDNTNNLIRVFVAIILDKKKPAKSRRPYVILMLVYFIPSLSLISVGTPSL